MGCEQSVVVVSLLGQDQVAKTLAAGKRKDVGSTLRFGSPLSSKTVVYGHCLVTLPCTSNTTLNMAHIDGHLNAEIMLVVTV